MNERKKKGNKMKKRIEKNERRKRMDYQLIVVYRTDVI